MTANRPSAAWSTFPSTSRSSEPPRVEQELDERGVLPLEAIEGALRGSGPADTRTPGAPDDWSRFWHLTFNIARIEWKLRFFGSVLGYFWQLMRPLLLFGVLYVFFTKIGHVWHRGGHAAPGSHSTSMALQMLGSIVLFTLFAEATGGAVRSVFTRGVVRKIQFPRMVIPFSVVLRCDVQPGAELGRRLHLRPRIRGAPNGSRGLSFP